MTDQNHRFFITAGHFNNKKISEAIGKAYPELKDGLPTAKTPGGEFPEGGHYEIDNSQAEKVLGLKWRPFDQCIKDTVDSLKAVS